MINMDINGYQWISTYEPFFSQQAMALSHPEPMEPNSVVRFVEVPSGFR
jgi:hypothetical protein